MSLKADALKNLAFSRQCFQNTTGVLTEADGAFAPTPESMTVIGHVVHVAQTLDWFREGGFEGTWGSDFEAMAEAGARVTSLADARSMLTEAWQRLVAAVEATTDEALAAELPANPFLQGRRYHVIEGMLDHNGHHRGALAVYARLCGKVPPMPYGEG